MVTPGRRRTLLQIGLWTTGFTALVFFVVRGVMRNAVAGITPAYLADASTAALKTLFTSLREFALILFWAGLVLAVVMYLIGPGRFPVRLRASVARWTRTGVVKVRETSQDEGFAAFKAAPTPESTAKARAALGAMLAGLRKDYPEVEIEGEILEGMPIEELVNQTGTIDLLVLGIHPHPVTGMSFSGPLRGILAHSLCPVCLVR